MLFLSLQTSSHVYGCMPSKRAHASAPTQARARIFAAISTILYIMPIADARNILSVLRPSRKP